MSPVFNETHAMGAAVYVIIVLQDKSFDVWGWATSRRASALTTI
jgi:hypothetical protein